jgi:hypothetical protein
MMTFHVTMDAAGVGGYKDRSWFECVGDCDGEVARRVGGDGLT